MGEKYETVNCAHSPHIHTWTYKEKVVHTYITPVNKPKFFCRPLSLALKLCFCLIRIDLICSYEHKINTEKCSWMMKFNMQKSDPKIVSTGVIHYPQFYCAIFTQNTYTFVCIYACDFYSLSLSSTQSVVSQSCEWQQSGPIRPMSPGGVCNWIRGKDVCF